MGTWWEWCKKYVFNIDTIIILCIFFLVLYFIFTRKRKTYKFQGLNQQEDEDESDQEENKKYKKKKKKRVKFNKHEEECRRIFQNVFRAKFKSVRPDWLKNPVTNKNLELDGYNETIKTHLGIGLAFEYDGAQHAKYSPNHFHKNGVNEFVYQVKKDEWKDMRCKQKGVLLIRIPHFVAYEDLERYIRSELNRKNVDTSQLWNSSNKYTEDSSRNHSFSDYLNKRSSNTYKNFSRNMYN